MTTTHSPPASEAVSTRPQLPIPFTYTTPAPTLHYQGAEALVYRTTFLFPDTSPSDGTNDTSSDDTTPLQGTSIAAALKYRPSKPWRHPVLDAKLTRARILSEARVLAKLRREGVSVPGVLALDWPAPGAGVAAPTGQAESRTQAGGWMLMEWVEGETVRSLLDRELGSASSSSSSSASAQHTQELDQRLIRLMEQIGKLVGRVHGLGVVHGDLTTSNLMVRSNGASNDGPTQDADVVLVDFGLAFQSNQDEDRAVDLYVLERAFGSSHPRTERLFQELLRAYGEGLKGGKVVLKRLEEVRMRGRKKIMIG